MKTEFGEFSSDEFIRTVGEVAAMLPTIFRPRLITLSSTPYGPKFLWRFEPRFSPVVKTPNVSPKR